MTTTHVTLANLHSTILSKIAFLARTYIESGWAMAGVFSKLLLSKNVPQRLLLSPQFSPQEKDIPNYASMWSKNGGGQFFIQKGFWKDIERACDSSLAGYVPYVKGHTKIGLYHFWSLNYGLRRQLLGHVVLIKGAAFVSSFKFILPAHHFAVIDMQDLFGLEDGDNIYVEVYHPKIPKGHGGHNGQLRYWGMYGDYLSTVHSMPVQKSNFRERLFRSTRGTFPSGMGAANLVKRFFRWGGQQSDQSSSLNNSFDATSTGFYLIEQDIKKASSVWHSSAYTAVAAKLENHFQAIALPPIAAIDIFISFVEALGSIGKVNFLFYKDALLVDRTTRMVAPADQFLLSHIFPNTDLSAGFLVVDLSEHGQCLHSGYIHLIYAISAQICDCVHSHVLKANQFRGVAHIKNEMKSNTQSLKFMHFPANDAYQSWVAIWTLDEPIAIKLRFLASDGKEYVLNIDIPPAGVHYLEVSKLFLDVAGKACDHVIVQIESGLANLDANLFTYAKNANSLSVDHFTGG
jgi:hypothetical protein